MRRKSDNSTLTLNSSEKYELCLLNFDHLKSFIGINHPHCVFLGVETSRDNKTPLEHCPPWFAMDVTKMTDEELSVLVPDHELASFFPEMVQLSKRDASLVSQTYPLFLWIHRYRFCVRCGSELSVTNGGYKLTCINSKCATNKRKILIFYIFVRESY